MNYGPLLFLAAFFALASSWVGFVLTPQIQIGRMQQTNSVPAGDTYPVARPGLADRDWMSIAPMVAPIAIASSWVKLEPPATWSSRTPGRTRRRWLTVLRKWKPEAEASRC